MSANDPEEIDDRMSDESKKYVREFLKVAKQTGDITKVDLNIVRRFREQSVRELNAKFESLYDGLNVSELFVKNGDHEIKILKFEPKEKLDNTPITVFFHGGGYCLGSTSTYHLTTIRLAARTKSIWLSVEYRLCPDHAYPILHSDCRAALQWAIENKSKLSSPNAKLGVCGDSSGGQQASILAHEFKHQLDFQILIYPCVSYGAPYPSYKEFAHEHYLLTPDTMKFFTKCLGVDVSAYRSHFATIEYNDFGESLPRCLIVAAELDPLVDDSKHYEAKLRENNIPVKLHIVGQTIHGFFSQPISFPNAFKEAEEEIGKFFEELSS